MSVQNSCIDVHTAKEREFLRKASVTMKQLADAANRIGFYKMIDEEVFPMTTVPQEECTQITTKSSHFVSLLFTTMHVTGAMSAVPCNYRKVTNDRLNQENDEKRTIFSSMTSNDSNFNEGRFKVTFFGTCKSNLDDRTGHLESIHTFIWKKNLSEICSMTSDKSGKAVEWEDMLRLSAVFNHAFKVNKLASKHETFVSLHSLLKNISERSVRTNEDLEVFFQVDLDFGTHYVVDMEDSFERNLVRHTMFIQRLHGMCQSVVEGNHRQHVVCRALQGFEKNPSSPIDVLSGEKINDMDDKLYEPIDVDVLVFPFDNAKTARRKSKNISKRFSDQQQVLVKETWRHFMRLTCRELKR